MAGLWSGQPSCIQAAFREASARAGFQKRQRNMLRRLRANHKRNHLDFAEGVWCEVADLYDADSEDLPGHSCSFNDCSLGSVNCDVPLHTLKSTSPGEVSLEDPLSANIPVLVLTAASWAPASPEASGLEVQGRTARLPGPPEDLGMAEEDWGPHDVGRHQGRARASRPPPRLGTERDRGPKLSLSKRKLELLLAEPEKNKRKKQYVA
ncbi:uncharacterized protein LOC132359995 [Balaenoptera ricei]|uniref:uncharacterized protein LOC132359995 n=1 Tax=Balaenoptera ricei TaxID=2746895 RepID=UPI0028BF15DD|nr:uncharacterized protein LOC132359995 [Balaenoptera ricei]